MATTAVKVELGFCVVMAVDGGAWERVGPGNLSHAEAEADCRQNRKDWPGTRFAVCREKGAKWMVPHGEYLPVQATPGTLPAVINTR